MAAHGGSLADCESHAPLWRTQAAGQHYKLGSTRAEEKSNRGQLRSAVNKASG